MARFDLITLFQNGQVSFQHYTDGTVFDYLDVWYEVATTEYNILRYYISMTRRYWRYATTDTFHTSQPFKVSSAILLYLGICLLQHVILFYYT